MLVIGGSGAGKSRSYVKPDILETNTKISSRAPHPRAAMNRIRFWGKSETALLQAIILMLWQEAPEYEQNFFMVMRFLEYAEVKEEDEDCVSPLDLLFQYR